MAYEDVKRVEPKKNRGGTWITFGMEAYRVPALSFKGIQDLQAKVASLKEINGAPSAPQMETILDIVHAAMKRNYPDLTRDEVSDMVDLENFVPIISAVLDVSGFKPATPGASSGEAPASTGTGSTSP